MEHHGNILETFLPFVAPFLWFYDKFMEISLKLRELLLYEIVALVKICLKGDENQDWGARLP